MGLTEEVNMPYTYLERLSACSVFCSRDRSATDTGFHHQEQSRIRSQTVFRLIFGSASTRHPSPQALQSHPCVAKGASGRSSARRPCPQVPQWHPRVAKCSSDRSSAQPPCLQMPQGHPSVSKGASGRSSARRSCLQMPRWHPSVASRSSDLSRSGHLSMIMPVFGTASLPTGTSVASPRSHCELVFRIVAELGFVKVTWHEPLLIIK